MGDGRPSMIFQGALFERGRSSHGAREPDPGAGTGESSFVWQRTAAVLDPMSQREQADGTVALPSKEGGGSMG